MDEVEETDKGKRLPIPDDEQRKLWVRSGGRCAFCNRYLLEDQVFVYDVALGEMAHIVGAKKTPRSPRGQHPLPHAQRNKADNLILLCQEHHNVIDHEKLRGDFSVERLRKQKQEHEERILFLTGLGTDKRTAAVRMLGGVRGVIVEVSRDHARQSVYDHAGRYVHFPFTMDRQGIEIDLSSLPDPEKAGAAYWDMGKMLIDREVARIEEAVRDESVRHLSVFALARIPLLVYLGYRLGDKVPTDIYQKQRGSDEAWCWPNDEEAVQFVTSEVRPSVEGTNVALILSISGSIPVGDLPAEVDATYSVFEIRPAGAVPNRDIFRTRASLDNFARCYHDLLSQLEVTHKGTKAIHLFPAVPVAAAIVCGRGVMRDVHPALHLYDRTPKEFKLALKVNER